MLQNIIMQVQGSFDLYLLLSRISRFGPFNHGRIQGKMVEEQTQTFFSSKLVVCQESMLDSNRWLE